MRPPISRARAPPCVLPPGRVARLPAAAANCRPRRARTHQRLRIGLLVCSPLGRKWGFKSPGTQAPRFGSRLGAEQLPRALLDPRAGHRSHHIYPEQYEGQECDPLIFCTGPVPAQQLDPFIPWLMKETGARRFHMPSADYIWPHVLTRGSGTSSRRGAARSPRGVLPA
jgi:Periplasmic binding protein domain